MALLVKKLYTEAKLPTCAHPGEDLAYDLYALEDTVIRSGEPNKIRTGIAAYFIPEAFADGREYGLLIRDRSSMASKGLMVAGGVVDAGYRGEIMVVMNYVIATPSLNGIALTTCYMVSKGDKIAQIIPMPVLTREPVKEVWELPEMERGEGGFGSSGR